VKLIVENGIYYIVDDKKDLTFGCDDDIICETPHIAVGEKVIDLEFERNRDEGLRKILQAIMGDEITDKYGNNFKLTNYKEISQFIKKLMRNAQVRRAIK